MDEQAEYSVLSKAAYDFFHGGEALAQSELQEYGLGDHRIDEALSDGNAVVITRPDGSAVVSYRGTDHMSDLAPDFQIAMGYHHNPVFQSMGAAHPNLQVIALRTPDRDLVKQKRSMEASPQQATVLEGHWHCMPQGITTLRRLCLILAALHSPNPSMRQCAPQSIVATLSDNAYTRPDAIPFP